MIAIQPSTITTIRGTGVAVATVTVFAADPARRVWTKYISIDPGDHTSSTVKLGTDTVLVTGAGDTSKVFELVGDLNDGLTIAFAGGTASGGYAVTGGYAEPSPL